MNTQHQGLCITATWERQSHIIVGVRRGQVTHLSYKNMVRIQNWKESSLGNCILNRKTFHESKEKRSFGQKKVIMLCQALQKFSCLEVFQMEPDHTFI